MRKMMLVLLILTPFSLCAQSEKGMVNAQMTDVGTSSRFIESMPMKKIDTKGSAYYSDHWSRGWITLKTGQTLDDKQLMYDIQHEILELKVDKSIYVVTTSGVSEFAWFDERTNEDYQFVRSDKFTFDEKRAKVKTFCRVLEAGEIGLISLKEARLVKANYNQVLDVGERGDEIVRETNFYYVKNGQAILIPKGKKKFLELFEDKQTDVKKYMKANKLDNTTMSGLLNTIKYYKTIM
jgi:hypothetical protein